jgi:phosphate acetyltransferase
MTEIIKQIRKRATQKNGRLIFPEAEDPRVLKAAAHLCEKNICSVSLIGNQDNIRRTAKGEQVQLPSTVTFIDISSTVSDEQLVKHLYSRRKHKGLTLDEARKTLENPLYLGASLVATHRADACVAGSTATTGDVIRAAIHSIGLKESVDIVSSTFLMALQDGGVLTYADCGVVPYPDESQLADIAVESAQTHQVLTQQEPEVAMLSFSTKGSARHPKTELVTDALQRAKQKAPDLHIDGEFQFDAAFVPEVAKRKAPNSTVAGNANVFIFPNLDAGNIAYKITERLGGASATGPILQGLAKPMMDLSRGCGWQDIVNAACVALLMD